MYVVVLLLTLGLKGHLSQRRTLVLLLLLLRLLPMVVESADVVVQHGARIYNAQCFNQRMVLNSPVRLKFSFYDTRYRIASSRRAARYQGMANQRQEKPAVGRSTTEQPPLRDRETQRPNVQPAAHSLRTGANGGTASPCPCDDDVSLGTNEERQRCHSCNWIDLPSISQICPRCRHSQCLSAAGRCVFSGDDGGEL